MVVGRNSPLSPGYQSNGVSGEPKTCMQEMLLPGLSLSWLTEAAGFTGWLGQARSGGLWSTQQPAGGKRAQGSMSPEIHDHLPKLGCCQREVLKGRPFEVEDISCPRRPRWIQGSLESTGCAEAVPQVRRQRLLCGLVMCCPLSSVSPRTPVTSPRSHITRTLHP